jgi:hypothetical protein
MAQDQVSPARLQVFDAACSAGREIFVVKDAKYDSATIATGVDGAVVEIIGISSRLRKMVHKAPDRGASQAAEILEILKDLHNYACIAMMELSDNNWDGK